MGIKILAFIFSLLFINNRLLSQSIAVPKTNFNLNFVPTMEIDSNFTISLSIELGESNVFKSYNTKYFRGFADYLPPFKGDGPNTYSPYGIGVPEFRIVSLFENMYKSEIKEGLSYSVGIGVSHNLKNISRNLFGKNSKIYISIKSLFNYSQLEYDFFLFNNFVNSQTLVVQKDIHPFGFNYPFSPPKNYLSGKLPLKVQILEFCPTILVNKNIKPKKSLNINIGPQVVLRIGDYNFSKKEEPRFGFGWQIASGIKINSFGIGLKYSRFSFASQTPFPFNQSNESKVFNSYQFSDKDSNFETLKIVTEYNF